MPSPWRTRWAPGFSKRFYENALAPELREARPAVEQQYGIAAGCKDLLVGAYFVDLLMQGEILTELKTVRAVDRAHRAQCINHPRATG